jgi:DUF971 family protein
MQPAEPGTQPLEIDLDRTRSLRIRWADGRETVVSLVELRRNCPCATCRASREERAKNPLRVVHRAVNEADLVTAKDAQVVGRYALKIVWNDGHDTGIYDFGLLRRLAEDAPA